MSLCERVMQVSDELADLLLAADATPDEGEALRLLLRAVDAAHTVKFANDCARTILSAAASDLAQFQPDAPQALNDNHPTPPNQPAPIVA